MKRAGYLLVAAFLATLLNGVLTASAYADCAADLRALRTQANAVKDERRRLELQLLLEKAEKDYEAGRVQLCAEAVQHARALLK
jgi:hypothetical protein